MRRLTAASGGEACSSMTEPKVKWATVIVIALALPYRRQGICGTLVYHASRYGFAHLGARRLVIVTEEGYHAARVYQSAGYQQTEWQTALPWWAGIT